MEKTKRYYEYGKFLQERFDHKVQKISINAGFTCPNRDGTIGTRGCIFCSGSGEFAASASLSIPEQLAQANAVKDALLAAIEAENAAMKTDLKGELPHDENF